MPCFPVFALPLFSMLEGEKAQERMSGERVPYFCSDLAFRVRSIFMRRRRDTGAVRSELLLTCCVCLCSTWRWWRTCWKTFCWENTSCWWGTRWVKHPSVMLSCTPTFSGTKLQFVLLSRLKAIQKTQTVITSTEIPVTNGKKKSLLLWNCAELFTSYSVFCFMCISKAFLKGGFF